MKRQQVISRFFASKPATTAAPSSSHPANSSPSSSGLGTVSVASRVSPPRPTQVVAPLNWRPRGRRRTVIPGTSASSPPKENEITERSSGDWEEEDPEVHRSIKKPRLVKCRDTRRSDVIADQGVIDESLCDFAEDEPAAGESDNQPLLAADSHSGDSLENEPSGSGEKDIVHDQSEGFEGPQHDVHPPKAGTGKQKAKEIPASDPIRHKRFVEKLLVRVDANEDGKRRWYGSPPTGNEKLTPLEMQVVELKAKYPDVVLMVEVGYKYRFYGNDAETAARILGIGAFYNHSFLNASIPTFRLHFHVRRLVEAGLKVGVIRQTETAAIKAHGANKTGPFTRGLSALYTKATIEAVEDLGGGIKDGKMTRLNSYLMCIVERPIQAGKKIVRKKSQQYRSEEEPENDTGAGYGSFDTEFGLVAIETATGDVMLGDFRDTVVRSELERHLVTCSPAELLLANPLSSSTEKLLTEFAGPASDVRVERVSRDCFQDGGALAEVLDFYVEKGDHKPIDADDSRGKKGLEVVMSMPDVVVQALALALRYLQQFHLENVLKLGAEFRPFSRHSEMVLSSNTLRQLEILNNSTDGTEKGSLLWLVDHTETAFGARLLRYWVTHPLRDNELVAARQDAVAEIATSMGGLGPATIEGSSSGSGKGGGTIGRASRGSSTVVGRSLHQGPIGGLLSTLGRMPDLERGLTRIFHRTATPGEFVSVVQALVTSAQHLQRVQFHSDDVDVPLEGQDDKEFKSIRSTLLQRLISAVTSPTVCQLAAHLLSVLNTDAATAGDKLNLFNCKDGSFPEVARCRVAITSAEMELDAYLPGYRKLLRTPKLEFTSINGVSHLVEAPVAQRVPANWMKINSTKKVIRYHPPEILESRDKLALAREELAVACTKAWEAFLAEFASHYVDFRASVQALAALDCLHSLALVARNQGYIRPEFVEEDDPSQLTILSGRHPILDAVLQDAFVPNDTFLSGIQERCQIITGPNMGGKSCYIRQVALIAIMAQMGSFVPAKSAKLHVFDSVQTRMGASDSLQKGASTFFEELSETSAILRTATSRSLVILDELGRGTSTHDGVAIAFATLRHLLQETQCLTLFVTHYPKITELKDEFHGAASPYYVSYMTHETGTLMESELSVCTEAPSEASQNITFLYKLVRGVASRSFGLHVARLAQIPETVVLHAASMAAKFEEAVSRWNSDRSASERLDPSCHIEGGDFSSGQLVTLATEGEKELLDIEHMESTSINGEASRVDLTGKSSVLGASNVRHDPCLNGEGHDNVNAERRKGVAEAELQRLLLFIKSAMKHEQAPECARLLKDIQMQARAALW